MNDSINITQLLKDIKTAMDEYRCEYDYTAPQSLFDRIDEAVVYGEKHGFLLGRIAAALEQREKTTNAEVLLMAKAIIGETIAGDPVSAEEWVSAVKIANKYIRLSNKTE